MRPSTGMIAMRIDLGWIAGLAALVALPCQAVELSERGWSATLSGPIVPGDDLKLRAFLALPRVTPLRVIQLRSGGGYIDPALQMAKEIRAAGLTTKVDVASGSCESACTLIFAGGVRRHYVNADRATEGIMRSGGRGLGYHSASSISASRQRVEYRPGTLTIAQAYLEMGMPAAAELAEKAGIDEMFYVSGPSALSRGIATSLSEP
jgi:hypothetical protein